MSSDRSGVKGLRPRVSRHDCVVLGSSRGRGIWLMGSILGWILAAAASVGGGLVIIPRRRQLRHRIVERLDQSLRRKVSRFDRRYREFVLSSLRFVDLKGLATVGFYTPELDD